jgi:hypothetical protein
MKTAVEWLIDMLIAENEVTLKGENFKIFEMAKSMEKEQIIEAFVECWKENMPEGYECKQSAEYYYNETYKGEEQ